VIVHAAREIVRLDAVDAAHPARPSAPVMTRPGGANARG
jgi:hypothetical protein